MARRQISEERQATYYLGMILLAIGFLMFISTFFTQVFETAVIGMVVIIVGGVLQSVGARGLAGSGVILDPEKAREDLEPWARMAGGIVKDGADEAGINLGDPFSHKSENVEMPFDEKLRRLHQLQLDGLISDEEYEIEKRKILDEA